MACTTTNRRRQERNTNTALRVPTVPTVADSCTAGWLVTDIYLAEIYVNRADQRVYTRGTTGIFELTTAIGQPVHGGTSDRILYVDNSGDLFGDTKFTRDSTTNVTNIAATVDTNQEGALVVTNDLDSSTFLYVGCTLSDSVTNENVLVGISDSTGQLAGALEWSDDDTAGLARVSVDSDSAAMTINLDDGIDCIVTVTDSTTTNSGLRVQGKDSSATKYVAQFFDGNATNFAGTRHFAIRNDGLVQAFANIEITGQVFQTSIPTDTPAGTTTTIDWDTGASQILDLGSASGNVTITLSNPRAGASYMLKIIQGGTARTLVWPADVFWPSNTAPTISTGNNDEDLIGLWYDGTNYYGNFGLNYS